MPTTLKTILSIAGSDPCGGAGIQADIRCGSALGLHVCTAITSITSQNSKHILSVNPVESTILKSQLESIRDEISPDAVKIGMLGSAENAKAVGELIKDLPEDIDVVVDPVLRASVGQSLFSDRQDDLIGIYLSDIFPFSSVITPNIEESYEILKVMGIRPSCHIKQLGLQLMQHLECNSIILKGGHEDKEEITDYFIDYCQGVTVISETTHPKLRCKNLHGTGCAYSAILASFLALGFPLQEAFLKTSTKLYDIISNSGDYVLGSSTYGPLNINSYHL